MMKEEFEKLTGIFPSEALYEHIEAAYYEFNGEKQAFCEAYKTNAGGLAQKIQYEADMGAFKAQQEHREKITSRDAQIDKLEKELERELEWKPYEDKDNTSQADYDKLATAGGTEKMSDERAKELLYDWYGFAKEKIKILHSVPVYEVNRHGRLRKIGELERSPLYNATDWNYIRFDCGCMSYELYNDSLRPFIC